MGNINASAFINSGVEVPGPRINPLLIDQDNLSKDEKNLLWHE